MDAGDERENQKDEALKTFSDWAAHIMIQIEEGDSILIKPL